MIGAVLVAVFARVPSAQPVDLALVLAVDTSGSVDPLEFDLQRRGYAEALTHPEVLRAIKSGANGAVAVALFEWSGPSLQSYVVNWTRIDGPETAEAVAARPISAPRTIFGGGTSVSGAIDTGRALLRANPFPASRRVFDVSGDGANNRGRPAETARDDAVAEGITINGLAILGSELGLEESYRDRVIGGRGAFLVIAANHADFAQAVLRKLLTELIVSDVRKSEPAPSSS